MGKKIRVGVVGLGGIGNFHAMAIRQNSDCELVAVFDSNPQAVEKAAGSYPGAKPCKTFKEFLETPGMTAVVVGTPNNMHAEYSIAAAKKGMHVLCEKPLAMNPAEAKKMLKAIQDNKVVGMADFNYRAIPSFRAMRQMVRDGKFGKIYRVRAEYLQSWLRDPKGPLVWRSDKQFAGFGALGDLGSHIIDSICYITGASPKRAIGVHAINVHTKVNPATGKTAKVTADTDAQFMIDFGSFVASCETSQVEVGNGSGLSVSVSAEKGSFYITSNDRHGYQIALDESGAKASGTKLERVEVAEELKTEGTFNGGFFQAILKKQRDYPTFEDGYIVQKALDAIGRSMESGKWEKI